MHTHICKPGGMAMCGISSTLLWDSAVMSCTCGACLTCFVLRNLVSNSLWFPQSHAIVHWPKVFGQWQGRRISGIMCCSADAVALSCSSARLAAPVLYLHAIQEIPMCRTKGGADSMGMTVFDLESLDELTGRRIAVDNHCFGCTAGSGSSCQGAVA